MSRWSRRRILVAGVSLILVVNAIALGGAAYNRSGEPESVLALTQRELKLPYVRHEVKDNSGMSLTLQWRVPVEPSEPLSYYEGFGGSPKWLDRKKLASLGFDVSSLDRLADTGRYFDRHFAKEVFIVLELDGPARQRSLERARDGADKAEAALAANRADKELAQKTKMANERLRREQYEFSRLFAIDAGLNIDSLRSKFPDRTRFAIVRGKVRPTYGSDGRGAPSGQITGLSNDAINVPLAFREAFESPEQGKQRGASAAPFSVKLAFGQRLEPWIADASRPN